MLGHLLEFAANALLVSGGYLAAYWLMEWREERR